MIHFQRRPEMSDKLYAQSCYMFLSTEFRFMIIWKVCESVVFFTPLGGKIEQLTQLLTECADDV